MNVRVGNPGEVLNAPLREEILWKVESGEETWSGICRRLGWMRADGKGNINGDTSRLQRALGLRPETPAAGGATRTAMRYETALVICEAINADPVDFGL